MPKKDKFSGFVADMRAYTAIVNELIRRLVPKLAEVPVQVPAVFEFRRTIEDAGDDLIYRIELLLKAYPRWGSGACDPPPWGDTRQLPDLEAIHVESLIRKMIGKIERNDYSPDQIAEIRNQAAEQINLIERLRELIDIADMHTSMAHAVADDNTFGIHETPA